MKNSKKIKQSVLGKIILCLFGILFFPQSEARLPRYKGEVALDALLKKAKIKCSDLQKLKGSIIEIIYTNEGRRSFANWMKDRRPHKGSECGATYNDVLEIKRESKFKKGSPFFNLLTLVMKEGNVDNCSFSKLANFSFPCWSGTLTCYMHKPAGKSLAKLALEYNLVPQACRWLLIKEEKFTPLLQPLLELQAQRINNNSISEKKETDKNSLETRIRVIQQNLLEKDKVWQQNPLLVPILGILFTLELIDNWKQLQKIVEDNNLLEPSLEQYVPEHSGCLVHVPNTASYHIMNQDQKRDLVADCHFITLRNLIVLLLQGKYDNIQDSDTINYLKTHASTSEKIETLAGETDFTKHYEWVYSLPYKIRNNPQSTAKWIVNSIAILSGNVETDGESFEELSRNLKQSICKLRGTKNDSKLIVKIEAWNEDKLCGSWPVEKITIKDPITHKGITIGSGGDRKHCEIMNIYDYYQ